MTPVDCVAAASSDDKKWALTIFARSPKTGKAVWVYQLIPPWGSNYNDTNQNIFAYISVRGRVTPALVHFNPDGWTYIFDRRNGRLLGSHANDSTANWADTGTLSPDSGGAVPRRPPGALSPATGLMIVEQR